MDKKYIAVPGRLESVAADGQIAGANQVFDDISQTKQEVLNEAIRDKEYAPASFSGLGRKFLRKNISDNKNILTQDMMNIPNTIYHIQYDYDLNGQTIMMPANCVLEFDGGKLHGGTFVGNNTNIDAPLVTIFGNDVSFEGTWMCDEIYPQWFSAKGDGVTNDTLSFMSLVSLANCISSANVKIPTGHYNIGDRLLFTKNVSITGDGDASWLDFSSHIGGTDYYDLLIRGGESALTNVLTENASNGDLSITLDSTEDISVGDIIAIVDNADGSLFDEDMRVSGRAYYREYYKQGDYATVKAIDGNVVTLYDALYGNYNVSGDIRLYKISPISCIVSGLKITSADAISVPGALTLGVTDCTNVVIDNVTLYGTNNAHIYVSKSLGITITNINIDYLSAPVGTNYGILVGNSKDIIVRDCNVRVTRHGVTFGGNSSIQVPCRNILVEGGTYSINGASEQACIDTHENTEYATFSNIACDGGMYTGGNHIRVLGCLFTTKSLVASPILHFRPIGDDIIARGNTFRVDSINRISSSRQAIFFNVSCVSKTGWTTEISDNNIDVSRSALLVNSSEFDGIRVSGTMLTEINHICITGNVITFGGGLAVNTANGDSKTVVHPAIFMQDAVKNIDIHNNTLRGCEIRIFPKNAIGANIRVERNSISGGNSGAILIDKDGTVLSYNRCSICDNVISDLPIAGNRGILLKEATSSPSLVNIARNTFVNVCVGVEIPASSNNIQMMTVDGNTYQHLSTLPQKIFLYIKNVATLRMGKNNNVSGGSVSLSDIQNLKSIYYPSGTSSPNTEDNVAGNMYYNTRFSRPQWYNGNSWVEYDGENTGIQRVSNSANRPTPSKTGFLFYDSTLARPAWYYNSWYDSDGFALNRKRGTTAQRLEISPVPNGYQYFDTDLGLWVYYSSKRQGWFLLDGSAITSE